ncbi:hypothetical protein L5M43_14480 [Shewanella sp. SW36]|uniref:hypothetical protein n=1 Tax=unclassified Shewanella TaxID=196818 RepID=UPI0021DB0B74|nr:MULTISPECIES: hypothetical protein [unclassified Shewanella]MCU7976445.1 hypothetical protein [Shewanella sp. SW36]MCU7991685.1 hypothetical protein [Shewanella sp. SW1]MCU8053065.1 hypothetical protein [Shewanella sp. SM43]
MNHLLPGFESQERVALLLSLTRISSPEVIAALTLHYTSALPAERAAARHGIELSNFMRGQKKLEQIAATVEAIKAIDWAKLQSNPLLTNPLQPKQVA